MNTMLVLGDSGEVQNGTFDKYKTTRGKERAGDFAHAMEEEVL